MAIEDGTAIEDLAFLVRGFFEKISLWRTKVFCNRRLKDALALRSRPFAKMPL